MVVKIQSHKFVGTKCNESYRRHWTLLDKENKTLIIKHDVHGQKFDSGIFFILNTCL